MDRHHHFLAATAVGGMAPRLVGLAEAVSLQGRNNLARLDVAEFRAHTVTVATGASTTAVAAGKGSP